MGHNKIGNNIAEDKEHIRDYNIVVGRHIQKWGIDNTRDDDGGDDDGNIDIRRNRTFLTSRKTDFKSD